MRIVLTVIALVVIFVVIPVVTGWRDGGNHRPGGF